MIRKEESKRIALELVVPWSRAKIKDEFFNANLLFSRFESVAYASGPWAINVRKILIKGFCVRHSIQRPSRIVTNPRA